jgi:hypothetical protein
MKRWEIICPIGTNHTPVFARQTCRFLNHIKPALEKRLTESIAVEHSCEIRQLTARACDWSLKKAIETIEA